MTTVWKSINSRQIGLGYSHFQPLVTFSIAFNLESSYAKISSRSAPSTYVWSGSEVGKGNSRPCLLISRIFESIELFRVTPGQVRRVVVGSHKHGRAKVTA
jgi:hypothetical protein